jgi:hypothetical protein
MQSLKITVISAVLLILSSASYAANIEVLKVPKSRSVFDISHDYHVQLMMNALDRSGDYPILPRLEETFEMSMGRAEQELKTGDKLDIYWLGASKTNTEGLRAIHYPTTKGLIGYRKFLINKASKAKLDNVKSIEMLSELNACQGTHWPDTRILGQANLPLTTSTDYETLFRLLERGRCDYFPRGYHDFVGELETRQGLYPNLVKYDRIMLHYPYAVYFYTSSKNEALAQSLEKGLERMFRSGEMTTFMQLHPLTSDIFPLADESATLILEIENPDLPDESEPQNPVYWLQPADFNFNN